MNEPVDIPHYVALVVPEAISLDGVRMWAACVRDKAPAGSTSTVQTDSDKGKKSAQMIHRTTEEGEHRYIVPLCRDLTEGEAERIVEAYTERHPDGEYDICATCIADIGSLSDSPTEEQNQYASLARDWAKKQHQTWLKSRTEDGWRYGINVSLKDKTHPLLRPWDELPERFRYVDINEPQNLLNLLNDSGYAVISKADLNAVLKLIQKIT